MYSHNVWRMENPKMKNRGVIGKKAWLLLVVLFYFSCKFTEKIEIIRCKDNVPKLTLISFSLILNGKKSWRVPSWKERRKAKDLFRT